MKKRSNGLVKGEGFPYGRFVTEGEVVEISLNTRHGDVKFGISGSYCGILV